MIRYAMAALFTLLPLAAHAQVEQQELVDRATLAVQDVANDPDNGQVRSLMRRARAVMVCPRVFRAGFILGGQGGNCVLAARDGAGSWSYPAFYSLGSGSLGLQVGIQDAEIMFMIMSDKGLTAVIDTQLKIGADAALAFATLGGGVEGATSAASNADIVAYSKTRGLFAGLTLSGSLITAKSDWNRAYYGQAFATSQIVEQMQARNPAADPLRAVLTRSGTASAPGPMATPYSAQPPAYSAQPPQTEAPAAPMALQPRQSVQQQSLPSRY